MSMLQALDLESMNVTHDMMVHFSTHLTELQSLKELWLSHSPLGSEGLICVGQCLEKFPSLQELAVSDILCDARQDTLGCEIETDLLVSNKAVWEFSGKLAQCTSLLRLSMCDNQLSDESLVILVDSIKCITALQGLELDGNAVTDAGLRAVEPQLGLFCSLSTCRYEIGVIMSWALGIG